MSAARKWDQLNGNIIACEKCPRLREYCRKVAAEKRRAYRDWEYWGRPVPNLGRSRAGLLIVGLAPAAHGANRTGRMFTGDRSGEWLFRALHKAKFASRSHSEDVHDGLQLHDCAITAACHCAPPANKPTRAEFEQCREWLQNTVDVASPRVFLALGQLAWREIVNELQRREWFTGRRPPFSHLAEFELAGGRSLLGSYHPSQQNTFTGRLTEPMLDAVFRRARKLLR